MKTIFIPIFQSFIARSILDSDAFKILAGKPDIKIIIFAPGYKKDFYNENFGSSNVIIESVEDKKLKDLSGTIFHKISVGLLPTYYVKYRQKIKFLDGHYLSFFINAFITYVFGPFKWAHQLFRLFDRAFTPTTLFDGFFEKYNPDLIFSPDIFSPSDAVFLLSAKRHKVRSIGMVRSWDCTTNKNLLRVLPEKIITNNQNVKNELIKYHDVSDENVKAVGFPQFDPYLTEKPDSKEEFFSRIGADLKKRLILLALPGDALSDIDWQYLDILDKAIQNGQIPSDIFFLVSTHPQSTSDLSKFDNHPNFIIKQIGTRFGNNHKATEVDREATKQLINFIYHSEIVITVNASLVLDAVIFDKPQIMLGFDGYEKRPFLKSVRRYQKEDNMDGFVKTGAARVVENPVELISRINKYLKNPQIDSGNRDKARKEILLNPDGKSGERIADKILDFLIK